MSAGNPKKSLGQHFLKDENIAAKIAGSVKSGEGTRVIEVGPGTGILTRHLLERDDIRLTAVEIDAGNVAVLKRRFGEAARQIIHADVLQYPFGEPGEDPLAVIGNFPYNISSALFFKIIESRDSVAEVVCMIQKEVAQRIAASAGTRTYGILSVLLQAWYDIEFLFSVPPTVFRPPPKVDSAVIRLMRNDTVDLGCDEVLFQRTIKACFNQRRKMIRNSIRSLCTELPPGNELLLKRPEQLDVADFVELTRLVGEHC